MNDQAPISHIICTLVREAIEAWYQGKGPEFPRGFPELPFFQQRKGVFVCLKKKGQLRGCIGTIFPRRSTLFEEITRNAVLAAREDPRFPPVEQEELPLLTISVDVLSEPEEVTDHATLDPARYGVIVEWRDRRGVLLPDLAGVDTVEQQLDIARRKADIPGNVSYGISRFTVDRYQEEAERGEA